MANEPRKQVALTSRMLYGDNLVSDVGHVSRRDPDSENVFVNPLMAGRGSVSPEDIVKVTPDSESLEEEKEPANEVEIHTGLLRARDDLNAVVHAHPQYTTLFGITGTELRPVYFRSGRSMGPDPVPVFEEPGLIVTQDESRRMVEAMNGHDYLIIRGHGAVIGGRTVKEAFFRTHLMEQNAYFQLFASILGNPNFLTREEIEKSTNPEGLPSEDKDIVNLSANKFWDYHVWKAKRNGYVPEDW